MTKISEVKFEKQLLNAGWKQKSKVKVKESKLLYQPKWTNMIARFGGLPILTVNRGMVTNIISFGITSNHK